jgi:hypothetical protein
VKVMEGSFRHAPFTGVCGIGFPGGKKGGWASEDVTNIPVIKRTLAKNE